MSVDSSLLRNTHFPTRQDGNVDSGELHQAEKVTLLCT